MTNLFRSPDPIPGWQGGVTPVAHTTAPLSAPTVTPPAAMPDPSSAAAIEAQRIAQQQVINRSGRTSTILSNPNNRGSSNNYDTYSSRASGAG